MGALDPWQMDLFWYMRMNSTEPWLVAGVHRVMLKPTSCTEVFDIMARLVKHAPLSLPMPNNNIHLSLMQDWQTFEEMTSVMEPQHIIKGFIMCAVEL